MVTWAFVTWFIVAFVWLCVFCWGLWITYPWRCKICGLKSYPYGCRGHSHEMPTLDNIIKNWISRNERKFKGWKVDEGLIWKPERHKCETVNDIENHRKNPPCWFKIMDNGVIAFETIHDLQHADRLILYVADPNFFAKLEELLIKRA